MNQIDDLSKENSRLKEELFELKVSFELYAKYLIYKVV